MTATTHPDAPVLVLGGMHRSGTSLLASLFEGAGLSVGTRLLGGGNGNHAGHFEDLDFQEFHQRALVGNGLSSEGFTADGEPGVPELLREEARRLVIARRQSAGAWGWKDPRTILFLDFWAELLPDARYVFIFRPPWDVADSFFRRGDPTFAFNPLLAISVWVHYNRLILRFMARHPEISIIRELAQVVADPRELFTSVRDRLGVTLGEPPDRYQDGLLGGAQDGVRPKLVRAICPEAVDVYGRLRELAGSAAPQPSDSRLSLADIAVLEWAKAARLERENESVRREWVAIRTAADEELASMKAQLEAADRAVAGAIGVETEPSMEPSARAA